MDAAARRPVAHFFLEAKRASEELERGGHVAIEEIRDDLRRPGGGRHGDLLVRYAQPACALLLPLGEGYCSLLLRRPAHIKSEREGEELRGVARRVGDAPGSLAGDRL